MRKWVLLLMILVATLFFSMCNRPQCADLVPSVLVSWDESTKQVNVIVCNTGTAAAKGFMVYINADENPESLNGHLQIRHRVDSLAACSSITLPLSDFEPLANSDNCFLENISQITVLVDPKGEVAECNSCGENNNLVTIPISY